MLNLFLFQELQVISSATPLLRKDKITKILSRGNKLKRLVVVCVLIVGANGGLRKVSKLPAVMEMFLLLSDLIRNIFFYSINAS